jgi:hypothetical protein
MAYSIPTNTRNTARKYLADVERAVRACQDITPWLSVPLWLAIGDRETGWGWIGGCVPRNGSPTLRGDSGHGYGYFQIDDRSHKAFLNQGFYLFDGARVEGKWYNVYDALLYVTRKVMLPNYNTLKGHYSDKEAGYWATVAAYNCGAGGVLRSPGNPDSHTTGHDYSRDVRRRMMEGWLPWYWAGVHAALAGATPVMANEKE